MLHTLQIHDCMSSWAGTKHNITLVVLDFIILLFRDYLGEYVCGAMIHSYNSMGIFTAMVIKNDKQEVLQ